MKSISRSVARDLMTTDVVTVDVTTPLVDVHRILHELDIHGVPVIDGAGGAVVGVVTGLDLLLAVKGYERRRSPGVPPQYFRDGLRCAGPDWLRAADHLHDRLTVMTAADAMVTELVCVPPDRLVTDIIRTMNDDGIYRVLVVDGTRLVGILSAFNLLPLLESYAASPTST